MKDSAADAAKNLAGNLVKQGMDAAGDTLRKAAAVPGAVVGNGGHPEQGPGLAAARPAPKVDTLKEVIGIALSEFVLSGATPRTRPSLPET